MQTYLSVFVLNGYEEISNLRDMSPEDLDYLGVTDPAHRESILTLAARVREEEEEDSACEDEATVR